MDADKIKSLRKRSGLSQETLASLIGVSFVTVNRWEKEKVKPRKKHVSALNQLQVEFPFATNPRQEATFRSIHYLGSKLRFLEPISEAIRKVYKGGPICDLFSGSATVAHALSKTYDVVAVDIQEYARVLASAVLSPHLPPFYFEKLNSIAENHSTVRKGMVDCFLPLLDYEHHCMRKASKGNAEALTELVETGSLAIWNDDVSKIRSRTLQRRVLEVQGNLKNNVIKDEIRIAKMFGGTYFSYQQGLDIDWILYTLRQIPERDTALAALLSACSEVVNTVGKQFAQPIKLRNKEGKVKNNLVSQTLRDRSYDLIERYKRWISRYSELLKHQTAGIAIRADYHEFLQAQPQGFGCIYADPPYTRDHYSRFYHVLETICLGDEPELTRATKNGRPNQILRGAYRAERHQSPFCIKSQAPDAFKKLFSAASDLRTPVVLSYSPFSDDVKGRPRVVAMDSVYEIAQYYFRSVEVCSPGSIAHSKLNATRLNAGTPVQSELLLICNI